uniref:SFRICE_002377 n=1 Tax=Spodoptera frugiperda TaxID=7108 RepID=A0A2H1VY53_SPOFR
MNAVTAASLGVAIILLLLYLRWKWREVKLQLASQTQEFEKDNPPFTPVQMVHRLCPHHNVVQCFEVEQKDSLDEHLDVLTRKLAEKEGRLRLSKSKIRETQNEIESLHAIDHDVRSRYREIMESLRKDLLCNEKECKKLQEQIEWVSRRRAQLKEEVRRGKRLYGEAAAELASNLAELQRGRLPEARLMDKPQKQTSLTSIRLRQEPRLPRATPVGSVIIKNSPLSNCSRGFVQE